MLQQMHLLQHARSIQQNTINCARLVDPSKMTIKTTADYLIMARQPTLHSGNVLTIMMMVVVKRLCKGYGLDGSLLTSTKAWLWRTSLSSIFSKRKHLDDAHKRRAPL